MRIISMLSAVLYASLLVGDLSEEAAPSIAEPQSLSLESLSETQPLAAEHLQEENASTTDLIEPLATEIPERTPTDSLLVEPLAEIEEPSSTIAWRKEPQEEKEEVITADPKWYFEIKPGYYYFTNQNTRQFFGSGDFTIRGEAGYKLWGPVNLWFDGGYLHSDGHAIGGQEGVDMTLGTLSLGFKCLWLPKECCAFYVGAAPRLFMMMLHNDSVYVRSEDNEIGIGGAFQGGFWITPIPQWKNFFFDFFADYSWKIMQVEPDAISSDDFNIDISGLSFGLGLGIRF